MEPSLRMKQQQKHQNCPGDLWQRCECVLCNHQRHQMQGTPHRLRVQGMLRWLMNPYLSRLLQLFFRQSSSLLLREELIALLMCQQEWPHSHNSSRLFQVLTHSLSRTSATANTWLLLLRYIELFLPCILYSVFDISTSLARKCRHKGQSGVGAKELLDELH